MGKNTRQEKRTLCLPRSVRRRNNWAAFVLAQMAICWLVVIGILFSSFSQIGCGADTGGGLLGPGGVGAAGAVGGVAVSVHFPEVSAEMIPSRTQSIKVTVTDKNATPPTVLASGLLTRISPSISLSGLPAGRLCTVEAVAYPNVDGTGVPLARGATDVTIPDGSNVTVALSLSSTIVSVEVSPNPASVQAGSTIQLTSTAKDASGNVVLVGSTWSWTLDQPTVATVNSTGLVQGVSEGTTMVTATESESGISGTSNVTVSPPGGGGGGGSGYATARPRIEVSAADLATYRANYSRSELSGWWSALITRANPSGAWKTPIEPTSGSDAAVTGVSEMRSCLLAYLATGDTQYRDAAVVWLTTVVQWNPASGPTSFSSEVNQQDRSRTTMSAMARAYDALYADLSQAQRDAVRENLRVRGAAWYSYLTSWTPDQLTSHPITGASHLVYPAIALEGDVPEATTWLNWLVTYYGSQFPRWGGADGGWSEGLAYGMWSATEQIPAVDALVRYGVGDLWSQNPWFENALAYYIYLHPVTMNRLNTFGDAGQSTACQDTRFPSWFLSFVLRRSDYRWWTTHVIDGSPRANPCTRGWTGAPDDMVYLGTRELANPVPEGSLASWPLSRNFADVGIVAMRTDLTNQASDICFVFKATPSPLTSVSHGHADQNSFYLHAYGQPLAMVGGNYYSANATIKAANGSTANNNALLFGGEGQYYQMFRSVNTSPAETAMVSTYQDLNSYAYAVGEAAGTYTSSSISRFRRYAAIVRQGANALPYCVVVDDVSAPSGTAASWLLHAVNQMSLNSAGKSFTITNGSAKCFVKLLTSATPTEFTQSQYADPPTPFTQWDFRMTLPSSTKPRIAAVLIPYQTGQESSIPASITGAEGASNYTLHVGGDTVTVDFTTDALSVSP
jgi:hypothetical protein